MQYRSTSLQEKLDKFFANKGYLHQSLDFKLGGLIGIGKACDEDYTC